MTDDTERLYELRDGIDADAQRFEAGAAAATAQSAGDDSGSIEVEVVADTPTITVTDGWRRSYEPNALGPAIMQVLTTLATRRLEQFADAAEQATPRNRPTPALGDTPVGQAQIELERAGDDLDGTAMLNRLTAMLDTMVGGIDETVQTIAARSSAPHSGTSVPEHVRATMRGRTLVDLTLDERWLEYAGPSEISREVNEAISAASAQATSLLPTNPFQGTPLAGIERMLDDPSALGRYLAGHDDPFITDPRGA